MINLKDKAVWICGSGPSLNHVGRDKRFRPSRDSIVLGVNGASYQLNGLTNHVYCIANDAIFFKMCRKNLPPMPVILPQEAAGVYRSVSGKEPAHVYAPEHKKPGTVASAVSFAIQQRPKCIILAGVDGGAVGGEIRAEAAKNAYKWHDADRISLDINHNYGRIRLLSEELLAESGIPWRNIAELI